MFFGSYNLKKELVETLKGLGYIEPTPIQEAVLPKALKGKSLICKSMTGSGKTHAFLIPIFNNIDKDNNAVQALIISPTVELASQTYKFALDIGNKLDIKVGLLTSSNDKKEDLSKVSYTSSKPQIVIGTPGRIHDIFLKNKMDYKFIKMFVLDECDMLLDEAYVNDIKDLLFLIRPDQRLIFTATMKNHLISDTYKFIGADEIIDINKQTKVNSNVSHHLVNLKHKDPIEQLVTFLNTEKPYYTMVFASEKTRVDKVYKELNKLGIKCALLSGDLESRERKITMRRIKEGDFNLIICSDIASRGIDIPDISTIISLDLPTDLDYYYHRAGRTGRFNKHGDSYIFYNDDEMDLLNKLIAKNKNINFDYYVLKNEGLKKIDTITGKKKKEVNEVLETKIKKEIAKVRTKKVKPGYKKKIRDAVKKAKDDHKKDIIKKNIREQKKANARKGGYGNEY